MAGEAIFIGYRRDDSADVAGRLHEHLINRFGRAKIFMDVASLRPGADFDRTIQSVLPSCRVALILIGPGWLDARDDQGMRRRDDRTDLVRLEIETALALPNLQVVPVLINGARTPRSDELPPTLQPLFRRHAAILRTSDFSEDAAKLIAALSKGMKSGLLDFSGAGGARKSAMPRVRSAVAALLGVALIAAVGVLVWQPWHVRMSSTPADVTIDHSAQAAIDSVTETEWRAGNMPYLFAKVRSQTSVEAMKALADSGNARAQVLVGYGIGALMEGFTIGGDPGQLLRAHYYGPAAASGDALGKTSMASMYINGWGGSVDMQAGVRLLREAADAGDAAALGGLGALYQIGNGVPQDSQEALRLMTTAAEFGNIDSKANLAAMYVNGWGVEADPVAALRYAQEASAGGSALGPLIVGRLYELGEAGLARDERRAAQEYAIASARGNSRGKVALAQYYETGRGGLERDPQHAIELYHEAYRHNHDEEARAALTRFGEPLN